MHGPQSLGPLGPFLPKSNEAKNGQVGPKPQVGPPEPVLAPKPNQPRKWPKHLRTQNWPRATRGQNSAHGLWKPPEATRSAPRKDSPQVQGQASPSSMHPALKDPGVVHIWYNIPL
ncbi:hypothetical protein O181_072544 [Austropuccinia psidii MF-1]|uniref:Uncharacterized protein n=1 Tax=Austropuccinia psidii MF-1 TaxID=1389203 RepID=A0A9Q3F4Z8_9BASI|nr:hypothetical protein [Austropuccinia psidii MF-1]